MKPNTRPSIRRMAAFSLVLLCAATACAEVVLNESFPVGTGGYTAGSPLNAYSTLVVSGDYSYGFADGYGWAARGYKTDVAFTKSESVFLANATGLSLPADSGTTAQDGAAKPKVSYVYSTALRKIDADSVMGDGTRYFRFLLQVGTSGSEIVLKYAPNDNTTDGSKPAGQQYVYGTGIVAPFYDDAQSHFFWRETGFVIEMGRSLDDSTKMSIYLVTEANHDTDSSGSYQPSHHTYTELLSNAQAGTTYICVAEFTKDGSGTYTIRAAAKAVADGVSFASDDFIPSAGIGSIPLSNAKNTTYGSYVTLGGIKLADDVLIDEIAIGTSLSDVAPSSELGLRKPKIESLSATNASTESAAAAAVGVNLAAVATNIISAAEAVAVETTVTVYYAMSEELLASNPKSATATTSEAGTVSVALSNLAWETKYYCYAVASATLGGETKSDTSDAISFKTPVEGNPSILFRDSFATSEEEEGGYTPSELLHGQSAASETVFGYAADSKWHTGTSQYAAASTFKVKSSGGLSFPGNFPHNAVQGAVSMEWYGGSTALRQLDSTAVFDSGADTLYFACLMQVGTDAAAKILTAAPNAGGDSAATGQTKAIGVGIINSNPGNSGQIWREGNFVDGIVFEFAKSINEENAYAIYAVAETNNLYAAWTDSSHIYTEAFADAKTATPYLCIARLTRCTGNDSDKFTAAVCVKAIANASEKLVIDKNTDFTKIVGADGNDAKIPLLAATTPTKAAKTQSIAIAAPNNTSSADTWFDEFLITTDLASIVAMRSPGLVIILR